MERMLRLIGIVLILALFAPTASARQNHAQLPSIGKKRQIARRSGTGSGGEGGAGRLHRAGEIGLAVLTSANPDFQAQMAGVVEVESVRRIYN